MCTLLILKQDDNAIAVMNRDDAKVRFEEAPREFEGGVSSPVDVRSGGTWIGVNKNNVSGFLLNRYDECEVDNKKSRGEIVLKVLAEGRFESCVSCVGKMDLGCFMPFSLVLFDGVRICRFDWNGSILSKEDLVLEDYFVLTSSSLKTKEIQQWRYERFNDWNKGGRKFVGDLPLFNVLQVKGCEDYSVMVERPSVCTLSITKLCFNSERVDIEYLPREEIIELIVND
ncbi:MAG: NRDE family protein [Rickettsiales bacterium]|nr:NRDE family protein [Rickettsiales bacterium]